MADVTFNWDTAKSKNDSIITDSLSPQIIYDYLISKGVSDTHAKGILSNIQHESNFKPDVMGDGGTSGGLFQHHNERLSALNSNSPDWKKNWKAQIDFALNEPEGKNYLNSSFKTPEEASSYFTSNFERPANAQSEAIKRSEIAGNFSNLSPSVTFDWESAKPKESKQSSELSPLEDLFSTSEGKLPERSPVPENIRHALSFGNPEGAVDYLKKMGYNDASIDEEGNVLVGGKRVNPETDYMSMVTPGLKELKNLISGKDIGFGDSVQSIMDIPGQVAKLPATGIGMIPFVGTKLKQDIGKKLGTYKEAPDEGYFNPEVVQNLAPDLMSLLLPGFGKAVAGGRNMLTKAANKMMPELPEKLWGRGANLQDLMGSTKEEIAAKANGTATEAPRYIQKIRTVMKRNYPQKADKLLAAAEKDRAIVGAEKNERLENIPDFNMADIEAKVKAANIPDQVTAGKRGATENKINKALDEIKQNAVPEESGGFEMKNAEFPDYNTWKKNMEDKFLSRKKKFGSVSTGKPSEASESEILDYKLDQIAKKQSTRKKVPADKDIILKTGHGVPEARIPDKVTDIQRKSTEKWQYDPLGDRYILKEDPTVVVKGSDVKSGKMKSDIGTGKDYYRKPTEDELKLMYESEKNASEKQIYEGPKKIDFKISAKNLENEKTKFTKEAYSKSQLKKNDAAARNKELADIMRKEVYDADEMVGGPGRKLKDINLEYDPLRAITESMKEKINLAEKGETSSSMANFARRNPSPAVIESLKDLTDLLERKTGQGLFNFKNTPKLESNLGIKDIPSTLLLQKLLSGELDEMLK